ncbi:hypothetical protein ASG66_02995 [Bacillus sp. Leaf406]|nr:hypothetical protein ASG66_02995 [Bacillus sp. Leaf406]
MGTELLLYLGGLALLDTLSPTIIGVTLLLILKDNKNVASRLFAYLSTVVILYFSLGVILMLGLGYVIDAFSNLFQNRVVSWGIFSIGVILFVASFFLPKNQKNRIPIPKTQSIISVVLIGVTTFLIEAGTALPYFAAVGLLTTNQLPYYQWLPILIIYNIIMILPAILIFFSYKVFGTWVTSSLNKLRTRLTTGSDSALSWIMCIVGLILIFNTLDYL